MKTQSIKPPSKTRTRADEKTATGVEGLDEVLHGGIPTGRATLLTGGPGSGKTVLAMQMLAMSGSRRARPGLFVTFEEDRERLTRNLLKFQWPNFSQAAGRVHIVDSQLGADFLTAGDFDFHGLLATLDVQIKNIGTDRIVFDSLDILLDLLPSPEHRRREMSRLHEWLLERGLTAIITAKAETGAEPYGFLQFMVDCVIHLNHRVTEGVSQRSLRVLKYRGSAFFENESPFLIGANGFEVAGVADMTKKWTASIERVSTGVARLDTMLTGGYYRGTSTLISGSPGTAKTTLAGAFAAAACARGENTLFVSFDSEEPEIIRNLQSVGIELSSPVRQKRLRIYAATRIGGSAETHLLDIKALARSHGARCLVVDPISALLSRGNEQTATNVVERLVDWTRHQGITLLCTSLLGGTNPQAESTPMQVSTLADTWIHLSYLVNGNERNRAITIVKSRGSAHSNQVRELILSNSGVTLADVSMVGGQIMMGSMRWEQERNEEERQLQVENELNRRRLEIDQARNRLAAQFRELRREMALNKSELELLAVAEKRQVSSQTGRQESLGKLRGKDKEK